jgi:hypothetical protein
MPIYVEPFLKVQHIAVRLYFMKIEMALQHFVRIYNIRFYENLSSVS